MYWTLELASYLSDAPWPATKDELIDYAIRTGAPLEVVENLQAVEEEEAEIYESIEDIWPTTLRTKTSSGTRKSTDFQAKQTVCLPTLRWHRGCTFGDLCSTRF
jgi:hypothetical protein